MKRFNPNELDTKWQKIWHDERRYEASTNTDKQKMYVSGMFPYPSGSGLHSGHAFSYTIVDTLARFYRAHDYNVLNPMGWDTFGLPAENYAIKTGTAPAVVTAENISNFKKQFQRMGVSIDWSREISTSDPEYYKWTQWVFTEFFKRGLAYQKDASQWWCTIDQTVLANEQVINGKSWRHDGPDDPLVIKKNITQWFFKITDYADALLQEIPALDWPDKIKTAQTNWIGKSEGAEIQFRLEDDSDTITVFSTRPDTLFGASFIVLAPEHPLATTVAAANAVEAVQHYIDEAIKKSEIDRASEGKEKTGVFTGSYAINPASGEKVPIWIADYVLGGYGTGAVMGVPAHDERDFAFAEKYDLPIVEVIEKPEGVTEQCYHGEGIVKNSHQFDGMTTAQAREELVAWLEQQDLGTAKVTYKMRDWLISRQRYWGAPIPIVHVKDHGPVALPASELPLLLPDVEDYQPKGDGKSVLASIEDWVHIWYNMDTGKSVPFSSEKPQNGDWREAHRETDTMDGYACSSWYLLRYTDPHNTEQAWSQEAANYWSPVDYYVGGDHAVAHLLYVRFWSHVFNDMKLLDVKEPVKKLVYHGYVNAEDGRKMSKSLGNVIDPLDIIDQGYGADTLRTYVLFMGPIELDSAWSSQGVGGVYRFLNRAWTLTQEYLDADKTDEQLPAELESLRHRTIKKVTSDYRSLGFNTAIASLMEYVNDLYKYKTIGFTNDWQIHLETLVQLLAPFAPHMTAELWEQLGHTEPLDTTAWPTWDDALTKMATITLAVQVNGKLRATIELPADVSEEDATNAALAHEHVQKFTQDSSPKKIIFIPGRLLNIVI